MLIGDMETNGLLDTITKIHCAVFYHTESEEWFEFRPENVKDIPKFLDSQPNLCMHNGLGFDLLVFKKFFNYTYKGQYRDSLLMSRVLWSDKRKHAGVKGGPHSVENWGVEFGIKKPEHEDWSIFSEEMLHRCKEDVKIQTKLYLYITKHTTILQKKDKRITNLDKVWQMEQRVWEIMEQQAANGWTFDVPAAYKCVDHLTGLLKDIDSQLQPMLPVKMVSAVKEGANNVVKAFTAKNEISKRAGEWVGDDNLKNLCGDFCKAVKKEVNINSPAQVKDYLVSVGWIADEFNYKKDKFTKKHIKDEKGNLIKLSAKIPDSPEKWEDLAEKLNIPTVQCMAKRGVYKHRLGVIEGLISNVRPDGKISAEANTCATNTARMTHRTVVNIPKVGDKFYGTEMRSLFKASEGLVQVGCDASALEARCEAHYLYPYDKAGALELINGDIHTKNAEILQITRGLAKTAKYALLYGCSAGKLALTLSKTMNEAKVLYDNYWEANFGLKLLKEDLEKEWERYGYLLSIDGRPLTIRYKHALINTLFQSAGSIAMKIALCWLVKRLNEREYFYLMNGNFHDEFQLECKSEDAEKIGELMVKSIEAAGRILKFNVPLTGEYKIGTDWASTH